jgi:hypothetical protein
MRPEYYGGEDNTYEVIKVIRAWGLGFELGNCLKYIGRAGKKDKSKVLEDLQKAKTCIDMEIQRLGELDTVPFSILDGSVPQQIREKEEELKKTQDKCDRVSALEKENIEIPVSKEELNAMIDSTKEREIEYGANLNKLYYEWVINKAKNETEREKVKKLEENVQTFILGKEEIGSWIEDTSKEEIEEQAIIFLELSKKIKEANEGWVPNLYSDNEKKWSPWFDLRNGKVTLGSVCCYYYCSGIPHSFIFKSEEICRKFVGENMELYEKFYKP